MIIDHTPLAITSVFATTNATGYTGSNLSSPHIAKAWRSTDGLSNDVELDLGADYAVQSLWLQEINFASANTQYRTAAGSNISLGTITRDTEQNGRTKAKIEVGQTARYLTVTIASGSPAEGYWTIGAAHVFASTATITNPQHGLRRETIHPGISNVLANGRTVVARTGPLYTRLSGEVQHVANEDAEVLFRVARSGGIIGVDLELTSPPGSYWPMEYVDQGYEVVDDNPAYNLMSFVLHEAV